MRTRSGGVLAAATVAVALAVSGCDTDRRAISRDDLPAADPEPVVVVALDADGFDPAVIEVGPDDLVELVVADEVAREVQGRRPDADGEGAAAGIALAPGPLLPGESTLLRFDVVGPWTVVTVDDAGHRLDVTVIRSG